MTEVAGAMALVVAGSLILPSVGTAATRHVGPGGSIAAALGASSGGDVVVVHAGTYPRVVTSERFASRVDLMAAPGAAVTIGGFSVAGANLQISGVHITGQSWMHAGARHVTFDNVSCTIPPTAGGESCFYFSNDAHSSAVRNSTIRGGHVGIKLYGCGGADWLHDLVVEGNDVSGSYMDLVVVDCARRVTVERNRLHDPLDNELHNDGIQSIASDGLRILRNEIFFTHYNGQGGPNQGIITGHRDPGDDRTRRVTNTLIAENRVHHWQGTPIMVSGSDGTRVVGNTAYDSGDRGHGAGIIVTSKDDKDGSWFENHDLHVWSNAVSKIWIDRGASHPVVCADNRVRAVPQPGVCTTGLVVEDTPPADGSPPPHPADPGPGGAGPMPATPPVDVDGPVGTAPAPEAPADVPAPPAPDRTAPSRPRLVLAVATRRTVTLRWTPSTDAQGVTGYRVSGHGPAIATGTRTSSVVTGLRPGTTYVFTVSAVDAAGNRSWESRPVLIRTRAATGETTARRLVMGPRRTAR